MKLKFGTGGLRAVMGNDETQMNVPAIQQATLGVAAYIKTFQKDAPKAAIAYDTRNHSEEFARETARVFAAQGVHVFIYPQPMPTPMLSFAVRKLKCDIGVCITASHNPREYNGYKVYGADGCQITKQAADMIQKEIIKADMSCMGEAEDFEKCVQKDVISFIGAEVRNAFLDEILKYRTKEVLTGDLKVVYTPLNGTGLIPMTEMFDRIGAGRTYVVEEQKYPDGDFPTCPYPNPEDPEAMKSGIALCEKMNADILLATDPDSDRLGVAAKNGDHYEQFSGNQLGILMLDYLLKGNEKNFNKQKNSVIIKTIVTTELVEKIAKNYGAEVINTLTGFKYIGEQIGILEKNEELPRFLFGVEESCGYLIGPYVRDKDAIGAAMLVCEMADHYKARGWTLWDALSDIYETFGQYESSQETRIYEESAAIEEMNLLRKMLKEDTKASYDNSRVVKYEDYQEGVYGLPKSNVLKMWLQNGSVVVVRPSGTEPKIKIYREKTVKKAVKA